MAVASAAITAVVILSIAGAGGTSAFLTSGAAAVPDTVITSGTAALTLSSLSMPTTPLYPGLTLYGAVTATNNGNVPVSIRVSDLAVPTGTVTNALYQALVVGVGATAGSDASSNAACAAGGVTPGWTGTSASRAPGPIGVTLAVGATRVLCVSLGLPLTASAGSQGLGAPDLAVTLIGTQE